jgi:hypothetical protein
MDPERTSTLFVSEGSIGPPPRNGPSDVPLG